MSQGPYASLNFAWSTGDDEATVRHNFALAAARLGVPPDRLRVLSQVHGKLCLRASPGDSWEETLRREGDALWAAEPGLACGVRVADCVPILVADERSGAACAIHSGWRGTVLDIVGASIAALRDALPGARLLAAVGPHISTPAFEISDEVAAQIEAASPVPGVIHRAGHDRPHADLRAVVDAQLRRAGVDHIDHVEGCSVLDPARFFSFRRDGARSGRNMAAIATRAPAP